MKVKIASEEGLKFPHSNSWESADTVFTNVGGGKKAEIAYSLREEKVRHQGYSAIPQR